MAFAKHLLLPSGVAIDYERISSVLYDRKNRIVQIQVDGYIDKAHSDNGAAPVANCGTVTIEGDDAETLLVALHDLAGPLLYPCLRNTEQFADAPAA